VEATAEGSERHVRRIDGATLGVAPTSCDLDQGLREGELQDAEKAATALC